MQEGTCHVLLTIGIATFREAKKSQSSFNVKILKTASRGCLSSELIFFPANLCTEKRCVLSKQARRADVLL